MRKVSCWHNFGLLSLAPHNYLLHYDSFSVQCEELFKFKFKFKAKEEPGIRVSFCFFRTCGNNTND